MKYETQIKMIENWLQERAEKLNNCPAEFRTTFDRSASCERYDIYRVRSIYDDSLTCEHLAFDILNNWQVIKRRIEELLQSYDSVENFKL